MTQLVKLQHGCLTIVTGDILIQSRPAIMTAFADLSVEANRAPPPAPQDDIDKEDLDDDDDDDSEEERRLPKLWKQT